MENKKYYLELNFSEYLDCNITDGIQFLGQGDRFTTKELVEKLYIVYQCYNEKPLNLALKFVKYIADNFKQPQKVLYDLLSD
ncbi:TPA: hypothetical protein ACGO1T_001874, partial [Streptococcus suis]